MCFLVDVSRSLTTALHVRTNWEFVHKLKGMLFLREYFLLFEDVDLLKVLITQNFCCPIELMSPGGRINTNCP